MDLPERELDGLAPAEPESKLGHYPPRSSLAIEDDQVVGDGTALRNAEHSNQDGREYGYSLTFERDRVSSSSSLDHKRSRLRWSGEYSSGR